MPALIFIWYLMTTPTDRLICVLWAQQPPTDTALVQSCGTANLHKYRVDVIQIDTGATVCWRPGDSLPWIAEDCKLLLSLDNYQLRIVEPNYTEILCMVSVDHEGQPSRDEIHDACGDDVIFRMAAGTVVPKFVESKPPPDALPAPICVAPALAAGPGIYDQAPDAASLQTDRQFDLLAGRLIWYGVVRPACDGGRSGLDPDSLGADGCGMAAAAAAINAWQNQFDEDIYRAGVTYLVPARLIKRIMAVESQFWPLWISDAGEAGIFQVSNSGVDVLLRYDPGLDPQYPGRSTDQQYWKRLEIMRALTCVNCGLSAAVVHTHAAISWYARILAAYRCRAVEMDPGLSGAAAWRRAAIDYNGSADYIREIEQ